MKHAFFFILFAALITPQFSFASASDQPNAEYNLYIQYCPDKDPAHCERIYNKKAVSLLEKKGFHIVDGHITPETIVIQLHDGCTYFEFCEPELYGRQAIIRLQDTRTYQIHYERSIKRMIYPVTSKILLKDVIALFDPFGPNPQ